MNTVYIVNQYQPDQDRFDWFPVAVEAFTDREKAEAFVAAKVEANPKEVALWEVKEFTLR